jgi:hypothetical protein
MIFTIEPFQAVSVVLLEGLSHLFIFARWRGIWGYTIPHVRYLDFLVALGGGLKILFPCPESLTPCPLPFFGPCLLVDEF